MSPLTIYKASAGSGKTHKLTQSYLELLIKDPLAYRHILAVTFTNKAASEMKSRILDRLHQICLLSAGSENEDVIYLTGKTGLSSEEIRTRSHSLMVRILNDFSNFSVGTIDRFFQGIIRAFTREIGLSAGFILELDRDRILGEAIDRMFLKLGDDRELLDWLTRLAEIRVEASRDWNFREEIEALGEELFSESYQSMILGKASLAGRNDLHEFISGLQNLEHTCREKIREISFLAIDSVKRKGYAIDDFHGKSRNPAAFFLKAAAGEKDTLTDSQKQAISDIDKWVSAKENDLDLLSLVQTELMPFLAAVYEQNLLLNSIKEISTYIYALGIIGDINGRIREITDEKNLFLLSDAARFLKGLIGNNPTPYIYEKTGNWIEHIMLDEFQDTSVFQWENFQPLLDHSLSLGKESFVVGDVKQSIYRWRNSDWKILAEEIRKSFQNQSLQELSLEMNWRSAEMIIRFNNTLFSRAPGILRSLIEQAMQEGYIPDDFRSRWLGLINQAYENVEQKIPGKLKGTGGYIRGEILEEEGRKMKDLALERLPGWIMELQDAGYRAGDIAILVRTNREGADVASYLMEKAGEDVDSSYNFNFVSNESLFIDKNEAVRLIICILNYLVDENDELNKLQLLFYHRLVNAGNEMKASDSLLPQNSMETELGSGFMQKVPAMLQMPVFELVELIIEELSLWNNSTHLPYIQAFQEIVLEIQQSEPGSLHDFLTYWKKYGHKKSIIVSEGQDAIRIITIHKVKGLQYRAVIVPFCDWNLTTQASGVKDTILWCNTEHTPFGRLPLVPVRFKAALKDTLFFPDYLEELIMGYIDGLNLTYVAFTRAMEALIIGLPASRPDQVIKKSGDLVLNAVKESRKTLGDEQVDLGTCINEKGFEVGQLETIAGKPEKQLPLLNITAYPVKFRAGQIRLRLKSDDFFLRPLKEGRDMIDYGNIMHEIFSRIRVAEDAHRVVKSYVREGYIKKEDSQAMLDYIVEKLGSPLVREWYSDENTVYREQDLLTETGMYRPDRVVIRDNLATVVDYKFGDLELPEHKKQVIRYISILEKMEYEHVEGYLWYVNKDRIEKVR